ncbi:MAG TPA: RtcB family protein [Candidatus Ratteibacteria bacterium]|nr:RtcB family protein [bacterium]HRS06139.1 RtcB family protein [Candidatus Ratteibacteria bacterium]HRV03861.1 RtcB family protein [Candidatus Ratteibacteria bacterium]
MVDWKSRIKKITPFKWLIPETGSMNVPGIIYISESMLNRAIEDNVLQQVANVACLPGIISYSLAMPDVHWGYGAPIGGVAAFNKEKGIIAPGFVGYDINCGVRIIRSDIIASELNSERIEKLVQCLYASIPSGVGSTGRIILKTKQIDEVLEHGARYALQQGYGWNSDIEKTEENGCMKTANSAAVSKRAKERGSDQLGTLGSGNHFLEIQKIVEIYDKEAAESFGLFENQITIMMHTGSRGLGYQVCDDYLVKFGKVISKYGITLPDRQLACAPVNSNEGKEYFGGMSAAANFAWANRQIITHWIRDCFEKTLQMSAEKIGLSVIYDVAHNIAKYEKHSFEGKSDYVYVHRKGATRAFPAGHNAVCDAYKNIGQPVLIPGTMGTSSYILVGTQKAMEETWGSTCHGAGRVMSRSQAIKKAKGRKIEKELSELGILAKAKSMGGLAEEIPEAYKDVDEIIKVVEQAGLSKKVAKMKPIAVIKG